MRRILLGLVMCVTLLVATSQEAWSQRPSQYQPAYPTFSSYYDYYRRDTGLLNPYYSIVRPNRQLQSQVTQLQSSVSSLQQSVQQRTDTVAPTGRGGFFMNYSHFYPGFAAGRAGAGGRR